MVFFIHAITYIALAFILLLGSLVIKARILAIQKWVTVSFLACISAYLLIDLLMPNVLNLGSGFLLILTLALPFIFWLYVKVIFSDSFILDKRYLWGLLGFVSVEFAMVLIKINKNHFTETTITIIEMLSRALSLVFVVLGLWEVARTQSEDLVPARIQYRQILIITIALTISLTILTELVFIQKPIPELLIAWQRLSILALIVYVLYRHIDFKYEFYTAVLENNKPVIQETPDLELLNHLKEKMNTGIWREEGLTIQKLADLLQVKEYRLRKTINTHMGYRNFNEFLNFYRIEEAKHMLILRGKNELNIQEIAYQLGYTSLSTFNKAFKDNTGITPTEWRKNNETSIQS